MLDVVELATKWMAGSDRPAPLGERQGAADDAKRASAQLKAAIGDRIGGGPMDMDGAAEFGVEAPAADEDLLWGVERDGQGDRR